MEYQHSISSIFKDKNILLGVIVSGIVGSAYYLLNIFRNDVYLTEDHKMLIEEIKEDVEETNGELTVEHAIQIVSLITRISDDLFIKNNSGIHNKRRAVITNKEEYIKLCMETFRLKERALNDATKKVLYQLGNISYETIQKIIRKISPHELEHITYKFNHPTFEENSPPDKSTVKEAFKFYANIFMEEVKHFQYNEEVSKNSELNNRNNLMINNMNKENSIIFDLLVMKLKIDDLLYLKFLYTEDQIRYLLYEYQLFEDPEVKKLNENINFQIN